MEKAKRIVKIAIGVPTKGNTDSTAYDNHLEFFHHLGKLQVLSHFGMKEYNGIHYTYPDDVEFRFFLVVIARVFPAIARERIAEFAVEDIKADYLLMFDDDMMLPMDMFERLYAHNVDIVAGLAFTRLSPHTPVIYNLNEGWDAVEKKHYYENYPVLAYQKNQLVECDAVGFGAVLIKTSVIASLEKKWFMTTSGAGEDIHFAHKARKAGFRVFVDTSIKLGHLGDRIVVTEDTYEQDPEAQKLRKLGIEKKYQ